jgi:arginyl-tRNA synthetase
MKNLWFSLKQEIARNLKVDVQEIEEPDKYGDLAYPCFNLAKKSKRNSNEIAKEVAKKIKLELIEKVEAVGPYVNFYVNWSKFGQSLLEAVDSKYGGHFIKGKKALVEHTSINPNASPHVGRVRNAIIGDSIVRLLRFIGYDTEVHFFVNDVGKQIAMLVYAARGTDLKKLKFEDLLQMYVKINREMKEKPEIEKELFDLLSKFESGDKDTMDSFRNIVSVCIEGQKKILSSLGIEYDHFDYESDYIINKKTDEILEILKKKGKIFTDEEGRLVLDLKGFDIPMESPALVLSRSNGTSLYQLRDIAYTIDKIKRSKDLNIIVLGEDQKLYFQQLSAALTILGYTPPKVVHYSFVLLPSGKMSTRRGEVVLLEDFMREAYEKALKEIENRYEGLSEKEKDERSKKVANAAVRYNMVKVSPEKAMMFKMEEALRFDGNTGPYLQYTYARANSILEKSKIDDFDAKNLTDEKEIKLIKLLANYPSTIEKSFEDLKLNILSSFLYDVCDAFNQFYQSVNVLKAEDDVRNARLKLVECVKNVLESGFSILGIPVMDEM